MKKAVLFLVFNRMDATREVFAQIKIAKPQKLYIASDGARTDKKGEAEIVDDIRQYLLDNIDWDCQIKTLFADKNGGCGKHLSAAITWFFEQEPDGIILEDDCVPNQSFFTFCEELLDYYKDDKKIWQICGSNFLKDLDIEASYYFSKVAHCWGWASWANRWAYFDFDLQNYQEKFIRNLSNDKNIKRYWIDILNQTKQNKIEAWDYQWLFKIFEHKGLCVVPKSNLVSNIGNYGVHFNTKTHHRLNLETHEITKIIHPSKVNVSKQIMDKIYTFVFEIRLRKSKSLFKILATLERCRW